MKFIAGLFGTAFGMALFVVMLFSIPLNVIALMRLFGWEWWGALIAATVMSGIPFFGQIAFIIFAIMGAYYIVQADFNWQRAISRRPADIISQAAPYTAPETYNAEELSPERFNKLKQTVMRPQVLKGCIEIAMKKGDNFEGKVSARTAKLCDCYADVAVDVLTQADGPSATPAQRAATEKRLEAATKARCLEP